MTFSPEGSTPPPVPGHLAQTPTPFHVFSERLLQEDATAFEEGLREALPRPQIYFSTKTNALPEGLRVLLARGWGLEVVNPADRRAALAAGAAGESLLLNGAAWTKAELLDALYVQGVRHFTVDSDPMAELLAAALEEGPAGSPPVRVALRIHDGNSHFGFHAHPEILAQALECLPIARVEALGLHIHANRAGSPRSAAEVAEDFAQRARRLAHAAAMLPALWRERLAYYDLGGGIDSPWVYRPWPAELGAFHNPKEVVAFRAAHANPTFSLREAAAAAGSAVRAQLGAEAVDKQIYFEPGRAVCSRALSTVVGVRAVKRHFYPDAEILITDGSTAFLGPLHRGVHPVGPAAKARPLAINTFVYGCLPHSGDWLFMSVPLPPLSAGDRLVIGHTGAYFLPLEAHFGLPLPAIYHAERDECLRPARD